MASTSPAKAPAAPMPASLPARAPTNSVPTARAATQPSSSKIANGTNEAARAVRMPKATTLRHTPNLSLGNRVAARETIHGKSP